MAAIGDVLGTYELTELLGTGLTAEVFKARSEPFGEEWAVKVLKPGLPKQLVDRFLQEYAIMANVAHAHVTTVRELLVPPVCPQPAIVLELVPNATTLLSALNGCSDSRTAQLLIQALLALEAVHSGDSDGPRVHRDVSPNNLLVSDGGQGDLKLTDFGFAKITGPGAPLPGLTQTGHWFGTEGCIPPEQLVDAAGVDGRGDLFALGRSFTAAIQQVDPSQAAPAALTGPLAPFLQHLCEDDREARPASASEALRELLDSLAAANIIPDGFHRFSSFISAGATAWVAISRKYLSGQLVAEHLNYLFRVPNQAEMATAVSIDWLFQRLDEGPVETEYAHGRAIFARCDPLATLYFRLYSSLSSENRFKAFRRLLNVAVEHNRFYVMDVVRAVFASELDHEIRERQRALYLSDAKYAAVVLAV